VELLEQRSFRFADFMITNEASNFVRVFFKSTNLIKAANIQITFSSHAKDRLAAYRARVLLLQARRGECSVHHSPSALLYQKKRRVV
jgi:hypothetical protein